MIVFGLIFQLIFAVFFFFLCIAFITGAPFVPSTNKTSSTMIDLADITKNDVIYDLGSGDGRLLFLAQKKGAKKAIGFEINPLLVLYTKLRILLTRKKNISVTMQNFWTANYKQADVIFIYLLPWKMEALGEKLRKELKPEARIVSNSFIFPHWKIIKEDKKNHVYVFAIPTS